MRWRCSDLRRKTALLAPPYWDSPGRLSLITDGCGPASASLAMAMRILCRNLRLPDFPRPVHLAISATTNRAPPSWHDPSSAPDHTPASPSNHSSLRSTRGCRRCSGCLQRGSRLGLISLPETRASRHYGVIRHARPRRVLGTGCGTGPTSRLKTNEIATECPSALTFRLC